MLRVRMAVLRVLRGRMAVMLALLRVRRRRGRRGHLCRRASRRSFDDLVEFAAIQPDSTAFRAIIDFDSLSLGHHQINTSTDWTIHKFAPFNEITLITMPAKSLMPFKKATYAHRTTFAP